MKMRLRYTGGKKLNKNWKVEMNDWRKGELEIRWNIGKDVGIHAGINIWYKSSSK